MLRRQRIFGLLALMCIAATSRGQLLSGDENFPILNEIHWASTQNEVRDLCVRRHVEASQTDSAMVIRSPMVGFAARTELQFDQNLGTLKLVQVKFSKSTQTLVDSVTNHLARTIGRAPVRTVKEKSVLIMTLRMEIASWRLSTGLVNLVAAKRGDSLFDASLVLLPPTIQQKSPDTK